MADSNNPWQSPEAQVSGVDDVSRGVLTEGMLRYLKEASPWLRFVGILSFIGGGILCLLGIGISITGISSGMAAGAAASSGNRGVGIAGTSRRAGVYSVRGDSVLPLQVYVFLR